MVEGDGGGLVQVRDGGDRGWWGWNRGVEEVMKVKCFAVAGLARFECRRLGLNC